MKAQINLFDDAGWEVAVEYPAGAMKKVLRDEKEGKTILLRLPPNFKMAMHSHLSAEQHFILEGEYTGEGKVYRRGTYQKFDPHEEHGPFESATGALLLVIWDPYPEEG